MNNQQSTRTNRNNAPVRVNPRSLGYSGEYNISTVLFFDPPPLLTLGEYMAITIPTPMASV